MPKTQITRGQPLPSARPFTDRHDLLEEFDAAVESITLERWHVLSYHGVGGIGKTRLLEHLAERLRRDRPGGAFARLDLAEGEARDPATALIRLRRDLGRWHRVPFPIFDVAFAHYWGLRFPHLPLTEARLPVLENGGLVVDLISATEQFPFVGLVAAIPRALDRLGRTTREWWTRRGEPALRQIADLLEHERVEPFLRMFFAQDLQAWLEEDPTRRAVLFFDTHEAFETDPTPGSDRDEPDGWLRDLAAQAAGVVFAVAGRTRLTWEARDPSWAGSLHARVVGDFAPADSEAYLHACGVLDDELRAALVEKSRGVPLYLALAVTTYERILTVRGTPPLSTEFDENLGALLQQFLRYAERGERTALSILSVPESFDQERFDDLMRAFATGYPATAEGLRDLAALEFVQQPELGRYSLHALVREVLAARHDPGEWGRVHHHLFVRAAEALRTAADARAVTVRHRRTLADAWTHGRAVLEPEVLLAWFDEVEALFWDAAAWSALDGPARDAAALAREALGPRHATTLRRLSQRAALLRRLGRHEEAVPLLARVLAARLNAHGLDHPATAEAMDELGSVLLHLRREEEAEPLLRDALRIRRETLGSEHPDTGVSLASVAALLGRREDKHLAESYYRQALAVLEAALGPDHPRTLAVVRRLADWVFHIAGSETPETRWNDPEGNARRQAEYEQKSDASREDSVALSRRAMEGMRRALGPQHPDTLEATSVLAQLLHMQGRTEEADTLYQQGLADAAGAAEPDHVWAAVLALGRAHTLWRLARFEETEQMFREAFAHLERAVGPGNPEAAVVYREFADYLRARDRALHNVEVLFREQWQAAEAANGPDHPYTLDSAREYAQVLYDQGRPAEAEPLYRHVMTVKEKEADGYPLVAAFDLARALQAMGRFPEAEPMYHRILDALGPKPEAPRREGFALRYFRRQVLAELERATGAAPRAAPPPAPDAPLPPV